MGQGKVLCMQQSILGAWLCHRAKKRHYQSKVFLCLSSNHAYAIDQLLIFCGLEGDAFLLLFSKENNVELCD